MKCSTCGKELSENEVRFCSMCKSPICLDCMRYTVVRKKILHKECFESIPVCKNCLPEERVKKKLAKMVDEVFSSVCDILSQNALRKP